MRISLTPSAARAARIASGEGPRPMDKTLLVVVPGLLTLGLIMDFSSTIGYIRPATGEIASRFFVSQLGAAALGLAVMFADRPNRLRPPAPTCAAVHGDHPAAVGGRAFHPVSKRRPALVWGGLLTAFRAGQDSDHHLRRDLAGLAARPAKQLLPGCCLLR